MSQRKAPVSRTLAYASRQLASAPGQRGVMTSSISPWRRLTQAAFIISLALVVCRVLMPESIRAPLDALAASRPAQQLAAGQSDVLLSQAPQSPGPATGIVLDLLFCLPALLILARRAFDADYRLLFAGSFVPMALLGALAMLSTLWAADKFACVVSASHFFCAIVFLWSTCQLVRAWLRLRIIAGVGIGLLMALSYVGYSYRLSESADLRQMWGEKKAEIISQHGWTPGSFQAEMFEKRVLNGQPLGYRTSTNTYAALLVLLGVICGGVVIERISDRDHWGWIIVPILALLAVPLLIRWTACRAAYATPVIGGIILLAAWIIRRPAISRSRQRLNRIWHGGYFLALAMIAAATAVLVHHGRRTGTLWQDSLSFRWRYWTGAYSILTDGLYHYPRKYFDLYLGVGWENFGPYYLIHRLATASEEIRDPHNFVIRAFVELGIVGGILILAWMLRLWWELTRPAVPDAPITSGQTAASHSAPGAYSQNTAFLTIGGVVLLAILFNVFASIDFTAQFATAVVELFRRGVFLILLTAGMFVVAVRRARPSAADIKAGNIRVELDDRPAPWILYAVLAGLATFLIHNLIEFSLFEPGPMFLFCLLAGSALGLRSEGAAKAGDLAVKQAPRRPLKPIVGLGLAVAAWVAAAAVLAVPVLEAESLAHQADNDTVAAISAHESASLRKAAKEMSEAFAAVPYNADYARRSTDLLVAAGESKSEILKMLDAAIAADPSSMQDVTRRAQFELTQGEQQKNDKSQIDAGLKDLGWALELDPRNVRMRLDFARELLKAAISTKRPKLAGEAAYQIDRALDNDAQLPPEEIKRLTKKERDDADAEKHAAEKVAAEKVERAGRR
ncbi:MAG TPA: hypothetical protein VFE47_03735 [Tepidisphaeraceae bacterium]|jgi:hypothetical protein|nr:hypothetical protein [Tepidisphaeraceae bacterium]